MTDKLAALQDIRQNITELYVTDQVSTDSYVAVLCAVHREINTHLRISAQV